MKTLTGFCLLMLLMNLPQSYCQVNKEKLYPRLAPVDIAVMENLNDFFYGCASGNCLDGTGVFVKVNKTYDNLKAPMAEWIRGVSYDIYSGNFSDSGRKFNGTWKTWTTTMLKNKKDYKPEQSVDLEKDADKLIAAYEGEMELFVPAYLSRRKELAPFGKGNSYKTARELGYASFSGNFFEGEPAMVTITYKPGNRLASFTGIVNANFFPLLGTATTVDGDTYTGSFSGHTFNGPGQLQKKDGSVQTGMFSQGLLVQQDADAFIPTIEMLQHIKEKHSSRHSVIIKWPLNYSKDHSLKLNAVLLDANGNQADSTYTGKGILFSTVYKFYMGSFKLGKPSGTGYFQNFSVNNSEYFYDSWQGRFDDGNFVNGQFVSVPSINGKPEYATAKITRIDPPTGLTGNEELAIALDHFAAGNKTKAVEYLLLSANKNNAQACYELAMCYTEGKGVRVNDAEAFKWYLKAGQLGHGLSRDLLGKLYELGIGTSKDTAKAIQWYKLSAVTGDNQSRERYRKLYAATHFQALKKLGESIADMSYEDQLFYEVVENDMRKIAGNYKPDFVVSDNWQLSTASSGNNIPYTIVFYIQKPIKYEATVYLSYENGKVSDNHVTTGSSCKLVTHYEEKDNYYKTTCKDGVIKLEQPILQSFYFTLARDYFEFEKLFPKDAKIAWVVFFGK